MKFLSENFWITYFSSRHTLITIVFQTYFTIREAMTLHPLHLHPNFRKDLKRRKN